MHLIEIFEFFHTLRKNNWDGVWQLDQFPFREDSVDAARTSIQILKRIYRALDRLDTAALAEAQERQDAMAAQRLAQGAPEERPNSPAGRDRRPCRRYPSGYLMDVGVQLFI